MANKKVLITGAAGRIGQVLVDGLHERYDLRVLYNRTVLDQRHNEEIMVGNITDLDKMEEAVDGMDAVVHMAGNPSGGASFEETVEANIRGTYSLYEACKRKGVKRVILASTNHVTGMYEKKGPIYTTWDMPVRPDSFYGASKAYDEALGRYYWDEHGLSVICMRIGSFQPVSSVVNRKGDRILSTWLSYKDTVQLTWRSIEAKDKIGFAIYFGISGNTRAYWDLQNAREEIGYDPEDNAEDYA
ncbi:MAG: UDP-glucose 4-epimerase [Candidatus Latescibacterota bacterium]